LAQCTIKAPESPDAVTRGILPVEYHRCPSAYATYRNGEYVFDASEEICKAIEEGKLLVTFEYYEGVPIKIRLTDNSLFQKSVPDSPDGT
jgi:hypothetical protein